MEGIKEWWSPIFFFFLLIVLSVFSCHSRRLTSCSSVRVTKSGGLTPDKIGHREQEPEE